MARTAKFPETIGPTKLTADQWDHVTDEAETHKVSVAEVVRDAVDRRYGLTDGKAPATA